MNISVKNATKVIKGRTVLDSVSLDLSSGHIYGLRGKNGSGKTMLLRLLCGLILPTTGSVHIDGLALGKDLSFPKSTGALIENPGFISGYSGAKNLEILASINGYASKQDIYDIMSYFDLDPASKKRFREYSLGMKQKLGIAAALMERPELILLDEPINALDEGSSEKVLSILKKRKDEGALIVVASHDREELDYLADDIMEMRDGRILSSPFSGGTNEV